MVSTGWYTVTDIASYLFDKFKVPSEKVFFFNTYFYTALTKNTGRKDINYDAVKRWTSKDDIFSHDYIVVPINEDTHWYLAIICNVASIARKPMVEDFDIIPSSVTPAEEASEPIKVVASKSVSVETLSSDQIQEPMLFDEHEDGSIDLVDPDAGGPAIDTLTNHAQNVSLHLPAAESVHASNGLVDTGASVSVLSGANDSQIKKKSKRRPVPTRDPTKPVVIILDSLAQTRTNAVRVLKAWLAEEGMAKRAMDVEIKEKGFYPKHTQIPVQSKFSDCGIYVLGYVQKFFQNPDAFKTQILMGEMSADTDWPDMDPKTMRAELRGLLFDLKKKQDEVRKAEYKAKKQATNRIPLTPATSQSVAPRPSDARQEKVGFNEAELSEAELSKPVTISRRSSTPEGRLRSPFEPKPQHAPRPRASSPSVAKVSDSPPVPVHVENPAAHSIKRSSPKVLIVRRNMHSKHTEFGGSNGAARGSLIAGSGHAVEASSSAQTHRRAGPLSPIRTCSRDGSSDKPIAIEDSQEHLQTAPSSSKPEDEVNIHHAQHLAHPQYEYHDGILDHEILSEPEKMDLDPPSFLDTRSPLAEAMEVDDPPPVHDASQQSFINETPTPGRSSPVMRGVRTN
jgi:sentrin-specific protease 7